MLNWRRRAAVNHPHGWPPGALTAGRLAPRILQILVAEGSERVQSEQMVLASTSPRRRELLALLGIPFIVHPADVDEGPLAGEPPADMVVRLSVAKVRRVAQEKPHRFIVG